MGALGGSTGPPTPGGRWGLPGGCPLSWVLEAVQVKPIKPVSAFSTLLRLAHQVFPPPHPRSYGGAGLGASMGGRQAEGGGPAGGGAAGRAPKTPGGRGRDQVVVTQVVQVCLRGLLGTVSP